VVVTTKSLPASLWKREGLDWWLGLNCLATFTIQVIKAYINALDTITTATLAPPFEKVGARLMVGLNCLATFTIQVIEASVCALNIFTTATLAPPFSKGRLGGITVANYRPDLKQKARTLRSNMTDAEQKLWYYLRRKQIQNIQFYRQRPRKRKTGNYIVDFYAPSIKLIIEIDGAQHAETENMAYDENRTLHLNQLGLNVIRFNNRQILLEPNNVLESIHQTISTHKP
jgi:very-short-patch-repair endonuclease